eukprot:scaffold309498_cov52-Prasinocladus_malaysianus.AAC.1
MQAAQHYNILPGASAKVKMTVSVTAQFGPSQVTYNTEVPVLIHYPIMSFLDRHRQRGAQSEKTRRLPGLKDLPDLRLPRDAKLTAVAAQSRNVSVTNGPNIGSTHNSSYNSLLQSMRDPADLPMAAAKPRPSSWNAKPGGRPGIPSITLGISNQLNAACSTRKIALHCPYWLVNASSIPMQYRDGSPKPPTIVPGFDVRM